MKDAVFNYISDQIAHNDMFNGLIGGAVMSFLLFQFRTFPKYLWTIYTRNFVYSFQANNCDAIFLPALDVFTKKLQGKTCRHKFSNKKDKQVVSPSYGTHFYWEKFRLVKVTISEQDLQNSKDRKESLHVQVFGFFPKRLFKQFSEEVEENFEKEVKGLSIIRQPIGKVFKKP